MSLSIISTFVLFHDYMTCHLILDNSILSVGKRTRISMRCDEHGAFKSGSPSNSMKPASREYINISIKKNNNKKKKNLIALCIIWMADANKFNEEAKMSLDSRATTTCQVHINLDFHALGLSIQSLSERPMMEKSKTYQPVLVYLIFVRLFASWIWIEFDLRILHGMPSEYEFSYETFVFCLYVQYHHHHHHHHILSWGFWEKLNQT